MGTHVSKYIRSSPVTLQETAPDNKDDPKSVESIDMSGTIIITIDAENIPVIEMHGTVNIQDTTDISCVSIHMLEASTVALHEISDIVNTDVVAQGDIVTEEDVIKDDVVKDDMVQDDIVKDDARDDTAETECSICECLQRFNYYYATPRLTLAFSSIEYGTSSNAEELYSEPAAVRTQYEYVRNNRLTSTPYAFGMQPTARTMYVPIVLSALSKHKDV